MHICTQRDPRESRAQSLPTTRSKTRTDQERTRSPYCSNEPVSSACCAAQSLGRGEEGPAERKMIQAYPADDKKQTQGPESSDNLETHPWNYPCCFLDRTAYTALCHMFTPSPSIAPSENTWLQEARHIGRPDTNSAVARSEEAEGIGAIIRSLE